MNRVDLIPTTVLASCVLHNICLDNHDPQIDRYIEEGAVFLQNNRFGGDLGNDEEIDNANEFRDNIATELYRKYLLNL